MNSDYRILQRAIELVGEGRGNRRQGQAAFRRGDEALAPETVLDRLKQPSRSQHALGTARGLGYRRISQQGCLCRSL